MRVVYYTHPAFLEPALHLARALASVVELHLLLELSPGAWRTGAFDLDPLTLADGLVPADPILATHFPPGVRAFWRAATSAHLVVHHARRAVHPASWRVSHQAAAFIRGLRPQVLHFDNVPRRMLLAPGVVPAVPNVLSLHDPERHSGEQSRWGDLLRSLATHRAGRIVLHNEAQRAAFLARYALPAQRVRVAHLAPYTVLRAWVDPNQPQEERIVLLFGRLAPYKGLELLYEAAARVADRVPGVRFLVAGRPVAGYRPPAGPNLAGGGRVEVMAQYLSNARLAALVRQATVVVCPYTDATQSGVVLAAHALGRAVVATRVGGLSEYVQHGETGLLVPPGDAEALADALCAALTDRPLRQRMEANISRIADGALSWEQTAQQILAVYRDLLRDPDRPRTAVTC